MKILLREYLAKMRELGELDVLVADLLLNMQIEPLSKPQPGVRQYGVDIPAIGKDPDDGIQKLFLITIKPGDITRSNWNVNLNDVRPSLDEIKDVYITQLVDNAHKRMPKKIVLCCGGSIKQEVEGNWRGYVKRNEDRQLEYALWTGYKLALLIEKHFMDEYLFPQENQSLMRKALALLDQNEQEPVFFYRLIEQILFESELPTNAPKQSYKKHLKILRLVDLCLGVVAKWAIDVENTRPALQCAERALLRTWDFLRQHELLDYEAARKIHFRLHMQYLATALVYAKRIHPMCLVKDGLAYHSSRAEVVEYPLRVFEVIGILSTLGINYAFLFQATKLDGLEESLFMIVDTLVELICNNRVAFSPRYDGHAIEITLGLLLLFLTGRTDHALGWMRELYRRITLAYKLGKYFPVASDNYEDLIDMEFGQNAQRELLMDLSTILPTIAEWYAIIGEQDEYEAFRETANRRCEEVNLQIWYPDSETESVLYKENAGKDTGKMGISISLPEDIDALRNTMQNMLTEQTSFFQLSCIEGDFPALGLIASRHFRTPVIPAYWQQLLPKNNGTSNV